VNGAGADAVAAAQAAQRRALRPDESVWVAASAGTGKTKVLTDRLLALMLGGTDPAHILCLTFTRAAAAEMANRVNDRLARWTVLPSGALAEDIVGLTRRYPGDDDIAVARRLFARVLDVPGGAKILTIHAFCQSLLSRFPLEAGVPPEFAVLDERGADEALAEAVAATVNAARAGHRGTEALAEALATIARHALEERFTELITGIAKERGRLRLALGDGEPALRRRLCARFAVPHEISGDGLIAAFCAEGACDEAGLRAAAAALMAGSPTDRQRGAVLTRWCEHPAARAAMLDEYLDLFLTDKGQPRGRLITKEAAKAAGDPAAVLQAEAARALQFKEQRAGHGIVEASLALARIADAVLAAYDRRKRLMGLLDYDDLVLKALELLRRPGIAPWVLFKLDGGLDHILIDEAQDTNPEQWEIVAALAAEFFAGAGAHDRVRTVFAVGDPKQSIYSFQRADPRAFIAMRHYFETRAANANRRWVEVPLEISFRAAEPLLAAVDAVFRRQEAADGVALDGTPIRHVAAHPGHAGLVELWPPVPDEDEDEDEGKNRPAPRQGLAPRTRLARAIAATIAGWLDGGERLEPRGRALQAGDVIVLVRRRNEFVGDLVRALKQHGVPVAGADRLALAGELAVRDLIALGRFLLLPEDDLTLATVLKGPLFGFSEDDLFALAYDRGHDRLWPRLRRLARQRPAMREAYERLHRLLARADFVPPFELYAELLGTGAGRRAILERLGVEAADPIEEFLALALAYEREHVPSLQGFLRWIEAGDIEVKREFGERQRDELRILTVHGAKGLEAPVVFLPDTMQLPARREHEQVLWTEPDGLPLWCPRAELAAPAYAQTREALRRRQLQEYRRLLYVALTRAQYRLYVCGWQNRRPPREAPCWHALCQSGWRDLADAVPFDTRPLIGERHGWSGEALRLTRAQTAPPRRDERVAGRRVSGTPPSWVSAPPPAEPSAPKTLMPSRPSGPEPATLSPLAVDGRDRFKRGLIVHRLLQGLPELPPTERDAAARDFLALPVHGLTPDEREEIRAETMAVLTDPALAELWGPQAQAEVPVVGLIPAEDGPQALSGQIDRVVVTSGRVLIVDFKTMRPVPASDDAVPPVYLRQLALYRAALTRIYRDRPVECALLWTDGPLLMPIRPALLDRHAPPP
jgi:ATP-dependent helicase/nuclease subunit A